MLEVELRVKSSIPLKGSDMKTFLLLWTTFAVLTSSVLGQNDERLLQIVKEGFEARKRAGGVTDKLPAVQAFRKPFEGVEDSQKIRALALYLYDLDQSGSKWSMSGDSASAPISALSDDPDFINDWSSLRPMLQRERDPRRFYLLSKLVPLTEDEPQHDFIAERTHMLFADGRVAKEEGEYTKSYAHDVSEYAYVAIVGKLRVVGADFEPPPDDLPHEEQALILTKWLKEKWPGCENIKIPGQLAPEEKRPDKKNQGAEISLLPTAKTSKEKTSSTAEAGQAAEKSHWPWFIGGVILLAMLFLLIRVVKTR